MGWDDAAREGMSVSRRLGAEVFGGGEKRGRVERRMGREIGDIR